MANQVSWNTTTFHTGDTIKVHQTIIDGDKKRTQIFEGIVIGIKGHQGLKSFTVRKITPSGIGVEKIFPIETPTIAKIELVKRGKVRRAKLYYLRDRIGKKATKIQDVFVKKEDSPEPESEKQITEPKQEKKEKKEEKKPEGSTKAELKQEQRQKKREKKKKKTIKKERRDQR